MNEIPLNVLKYRIIGASTEDPEHPLITIISRNPSEGWNSVRFCQYPQEVLIQFTKPVRLRQINFLLHQTKIPSKIDIYKFFPKTYNDFFADYNSLIYEKIGYIFPDSNMKTEYKARELKKVFLNENCFYLKLVFHKPYINIYSPFNQVALISITCFGFDFTPNNIDTFYPNRNKDLNYFVNNLDTYVPKPEINDNELDEVCINKIEELKLQLDIAVKEENYDHAKVLDELINRIRMLGVKIKNLTELKMKSIEISDYDNAKILKGEIDRIRSIIEGVNEIDLVSNQMKKVYVDEREIKPLYKEDDSQIYNNNNINYEDINDKVLLTKSDEIRMELEKKKQLIEQSKRAAKENLIKEKEYSNEKLNTHERQVTRKNDNDAEVEEEIRIKNY